MGQLTRKDFRMMAEDAARIDNAEVRKEVIKSEIRISKASNPRFDEGKFIRFIEKRRKSFKGR